MHVERMLKLADYLENLPSQDMFNMDYWISSYQYLDDSNYPEYDAVSQSFVSDLPTEIVSCNTAGCIAGWAWLYFVNNESNNACECDECISCLSRSGYYGIEDFASEYLGLDAVDARKLFLPFHSSSVWVKYAHAFDYSYINVFATIDSEHIINVQDISNKDASYMLRSLATGLFNFDDDEIDDDYINAVLDAAELNYYSKYNPETFNKVYSTEF